MVYFSFPSYSFSWLSSVSDLARNKNLVWQLVDASQMLGAIATEHSRQLYRIRFYLARKEGVYISWLVIR